MKRINIRFDDKTYEKLLALKKQNSSNINALVNSAVLSLLNKEKNNIFLSENATKKLNHKI